MERVLKEMKKILFLIVVIFLILDIYLVKRIFDFNNVRGISTMQIESQNQIFNSNSLKYFYEPKPGLALKEGIINSDTLNDDNHEIRLLI